MGRRIFILILLAVTVLFVSIAFLFGNAVPRENSLPKIEPTIKTEDKSRIEIPRASIIASGLEIPWGLAFLPDGSILFTERPGQVRMIDMEGNFLPSPIANIPQVKHIGEGGLLGIAIHPDFKNNKHIYLYYTYSSTENNTLNRVARFNFENGTLTHEQVIVDAIPGAINHNGGRIKFGPDNFLYITTGDAQNPSLAQDVNSLAGKILRVTDEGKPAAGNPFNNLVYSNGHRNPQGFSWDGKGRLWATEHGPQARDELNLIEKGANYGWPVITGNEEREGMKKPVLQSGDSTWAPAGAVFVENSIFFAGLRGNALFEAKLLDGEVELKEYLKGEFGRIRDVVLGSDGFLYITTSNRDGRGIPREGDDKIIRINPKKL
ncbi:MAG: PQQ-dependent sugar dehydrogenase [Patescibacteria group bacterium]